MPTFLQVRAPPAAEKAPAAKRSNAGGKKIDGRTLEAKSLKVSLATYSISVHVIRRAEGSYPNAKIQYTLTASEHPVCLANCVVVLHVRSVR